MSESCSINPITAAFLDDELDVLHALVSRGLSSWIDLNDSGELTELGYSKKQLEIAVKLEVLLRKYTDGGNHQAPKP